MTARFGRVIPAMVTPFNEDGALDVDASVTLAKWLVEQGSEGLVITGTTGEGPAVTDEEDWELWRAVAEPSPSRLLLVPLPTTRLTLFTKHGKRRNLAAMESWQSLPITRPSQEGIYAHFDAVASATSLPVVLYDIPVRTGRKIETSTLLRLAHEIPNVVAVKARQVTLVRRRRLFETLPKISRSIAATTT